jgi:hypothetical protein
LGSEGFSGSKSGRRVRGRLDCGEWIRMGEKQHQVTDEKTKNLLKALIIAYTPA